MVSVNHLGLCAVRQSTCNLRCDEAETLGATLKMISFFVLLIKVKGDADTAHVKSKKIPSRGKSDGIFS